MANIPRATPAGDSSHRVVVVTTSFCSILQSFENRLKEAQGHMRNFGTILASEANGLASKILKSLRRVTKVAGKDRQERRAATLSRGKMNLFFSKTAAGTVGVLRHDFRERDLRLKGFENGVVVVGIGIEVGNDSGNSRYVCEAAVPVLRGVIANEVEKVEHSGIHRGQSDRMGEVLVSNKSDRLVSERLCCLFQVASEMIL
jgi:hypothetical protein